jgi:hypothetical protein
VALGTVDEDAAILGGSREHKETADENKSAQHAEHAATLATEPGDSIAAMG